MRIFHNLNVDWMGKRKFFYVLSAAFFLIGLLNALIRGFEFGIDFKGGTEIVMQFQNPIELSTLRGKVEKIGLGNVELKSYGKDNSVLIRTELQQIPQNLFKQVVTNINGELDKSLPGVPYKQVDASAGSVTYALDNPDTANLAIEKLALAGFQSGKFSEEPTNTSMIVNVGIADWIKVNLRKTITDNPFKVLREDQVGPKVGKELKQGAVVAIMLSLLVILIYLAFRFKFIFAATAVIALFHDVLITLGLYAALYNVIPGLNLEIDLTVVAAFLTLIGYSINDTVIVFDRVREEIKIHKSMPLGELMNMAINKTMSRTILTGGTTLLSIFILLLFGGEVLRAFSFTMFFGIIIGTYSSVFIASALVLDWVNRSKKKIQF